MSERENAERVRARGRGWCLWSTVKRGTLDMPEAVEELHDGAEVSADGCWATVYEDDHVVAVYVRASA